jgi:hypothetical protein
LGGGKRKKERNAHYLDEKIKKTMEYYQEGGIVMFVPGENQDKKIR